MESDRLPSNRLKQPVPREGEETRFTSTEAKLLEVLRRQPGRVFSRAELVALVMPDTIVLERTIDVHIKAIRQKLGRLGRQIETVRRMGYRFRELQRTEDSPG